MHCPMIFYMINSNIVHLSNHTTKANKNKETSSIEAFLYDQDGYMVLGLILKG